MKSLLQKEKDLKKISIKHFKEGIIKVNRKCFIVKGHYRKLFLVISYQNVTKVLKCHILNWKK